MNTSGDRPAERAARRHWRVSLGATCGVLLLSATVSFAPPVLAHWLSPSSVDLRVAGTPWPYFIGAQGAVLAFALLVIAYTIVMSRADRRYRDAMRGVDDPSAFEDTDAPNALHNPHARGGAEPDSR